MGPRRIGWDLAGLDGTSQDWMGPRRIGWDLAGLDGTSQALLEKAERQRIFSGFCQVNIMEWLHVSR